MTPPPNLHPMDLSHLAAINEKAATALSAAKGQIVDGSRLIETERLHHFHIDWTDPRGGKWQGSFTNHILSLGEQEIVGIKRAHGFRGLDFDNLTPKTWNMMWMVTHLEQSLEKRPEWANKLWELFDMELVAVIYKEVSAHEARFHRTEAPPVPGLEQPQS